MRKHFLLYVFGSLVLGCADPQDEPIIHVRNEINEFVWGGLNSWYFYQDEVIDLDDQKFGSLSQKNAFLNAFLTPNDLFQSLRHPGDRFSWIVDDYVALNNNFQGISKSFGYDFGLIQVDGQILAYIQYVLPGSPAEDAGLQRGEFISRVNGTEITGENYINLFFSQEQYTLEFADIESGSVVENGKNVDLTAITLTENPVLFFETFQYEGKMVGYLVYNRFTHTFHSELNAAFSEFAQANVDELVVDLRYNPGGAVTTAAVLGSLIYGQSSSSKVFTDLNYNGKHAQFNQSFTFADRVPILNGNFQVVSEENMNRVSLDRVYILTSASTASASELLINGLEPYMEVIQIGDVTRGKNEGSITLYDAPERDYMSQESANPNHRWAMQPIVFRLVNADGFGDYSNGLSPDVLVGELDKFPEILPFGDPEEPLLSAALNHMTGQPQSSRSIRSSMEILQYSKLSMPHSDEMYVSPRDLKVPDQSPFD